MEKRIIITAKLSGEDFFRIPKAIQDTIKENPENNLQEIKINLGGDVIFCGKIEDLKKITIEIAVGTDQEILRLEANERKEQIADLNLSVRTINKCKAAGIKTVEDLIKYSKKEILGFRNFGKKTLRELEKGVNERGLKFKGQK